MIRRRPNGLGIPLLERIIKASSLLGDVVLDAFCTWDVFGSSRKTKTALGLAFDFSPTACSVITLRLEDLGLAKGVHFQVHEMPKDEEGPPPGCRTASRIGRSLRWAGYLNRVKVGDSGSMQLAPSELAVTMP